MEPIAKDTNELSEHQIMLQEMAKTRAKSKREHRYLVVLGIATCLLVVLGLAYAYHYYYIKPSLDIETDTKTNTNVNTNIQNVSCCPECEKNKENLTKPTSETVNGMCQIAVVRKIGPSQNGSTELFVELPAGFILAPGTPVTVQTLPDPNISAMGAVAQEEIHGTSGTSTPLNTIANTQLVVITIYGVSTEGQNNVALPIIICV